MFNHKFLKMNTLTPHPILSFCKAPSALAKNLFQSFKLRLILFYLMATFSYHIGLAQPWSGTLLTGNTHRIDNVGIGLTTPTHLLHLEKAGGVQGIFVNSLESAAYLRLSSNNDRPVEIYSPNNSADLRFLVNSADRMTINANGNVGIGYMTPNFLLSFGTALLNTKIALYENNGFDPYGLGVQAGQFRIHVANSTNRFSFLDAPSGTEVVTITGSGRLGIGATTPGSVLTVNGGAAIGSSYTTSVIPSNALAVQGSVSIGTTSQVGLLEMANPTNGSNPFFRLLSGTTDESTLLVGVSAAAGQYFGISQNRDIIIKNYGGSTNNLIIANERQGKDILFGVSNPGAKEVMRITSTENVGIGITAPTSKFHVVGNGRIAGSVAVGNANNLVAGVNSLVGGDGSSASGAGALAFGGNTLASGRYSVALGGDQALGTKATGDGSVAIGSGGITASGINSMAVGIGTLNNTINNSLMVGYNNTVNTPTLYVGTPSAGQSIGNVGIGISSPTARLHVQGNTTAGLFSPSASSGALAYGVDVRSTGITSGVTNGYGVSAVLNGTGPSTYYYGVYSYSDTLCFSQFNYGTYSGIQNTGSTKNYAVYGDIISPSPTNENYAIYGNAAMSTSANTWAGYFRGRGYFGRVLGLGTTTPVTTFQSGDVQVGTSATGVTLSNTPVRLDVLGGIRSDIYGRVSDSRIKSEIQLIEGSIEKIKALRGVSYIQRSISHNAEDEYKFRSLGFIAQEIKEVFPELTLLADDGYYAVDYDGVIPVLVEAIKEQQKAIEKLQEQNSQLKTEGSILRKSDQVNLINSLTKNKLEQNIPNPFSGSTVIRYSFVEGNRASLMIFDLNGTAIHQVENLETGDHELVLELSKLASGMYYYSLVVDGAESVTKRMVLNK
jgi:hypothetical protein